MSELEQSDPPRPRTVLVTGALGNLGRMTLDALLGEGHRVRAFDLPTGANRRAERRLPYGVDLRFGSVTDPRSVAAAVRGVDAIAHFAGLLPPATERTPDLAYAVNVEGTRNLVAAAETEKGAIRFMEASSYTLYGPDARRHGIVRSDAPVVATDVYSHTKLAAEGIVKSSSLDWVILRIAAAVDGSSLATDSTALSMIFEVDPEQPIELVHGKDVALAAAHAVSAEAASQRVLHIGGGPSCRLVQRDLFAMTERMLGIKPLPPSAFGRSPYYTCWLDSTESERILRYQHHSADDIERDLASRLSSLRPIVALARPLVRRYLLSRSGPYRGAPPRPTWRAQLEAHRPSKGRRRRS